METSILSAYSKNECQKYFDYLERLRQSGETNMYEACLLYTSPSPRD